MSGKFNPFQSKEAEVVRLRTVAGKEKALKMLDKLQRKRPYVWAEIDDLASSASDTVLNSLTGETSVALFVGRSSADSLMRRPAVAGLITRLWKNFNKLQILQQVETGQDAGPLEESAH